MECTHASESDCLRTVGGVWPHLVCEAFCDYFSNALHGYSLMEQPPTCIINKWSWNVFFLLCLLCSVGCLFSTWLSDCYQHLLLCMNILPVTQQCFNLWLSFYQSWSFYFSQIMLFNDAYQYYIFSFSLSSLSLPDTIQVQHDWYDCHVLKHWIMGLWYICRNRLL